MKGNEYTLQSRAAVSPRFYKDHVTASYNIQWQGDSFTLIGDDSKKWPRLPFTARVIQFPISLSMGSLVDPRLCASNEHISIMLLPSLLVASSGMGAD